MDMGELKEVLEKVAEYQPALVMTLLETGDARQGYHPEPSDSSPEWCKCSNCREMPTDAEKKCCGYTPSNCLSKDPVTILQNYFLYFILCNS